MQEDLTWIPSLSPLSLRVLRASVVRTSSLCDTTGFPPQRGRAITPAGHLLAAIALLCWPAVVLAGGGPEGVLLVVNPQSPASLTIANHYAQLRAIPFENLLYLPWPPNLPTADVDTFRQRILLARAVGHADSGFNRPDRLRRVLQRLPLGDLAGQ